MKKAAWKARRSNTLIDNHHISDHFSYILAVFLAVFGEAARRAE
ncbi:MAG: hypothetical protein Q4A28_09530 [Brachymonas sp.]|nr:hypothetical protein [Brachymonas sp.]